MRRLCNLLCILAAAWAVPGCATRELNPVPDPVPGEYRHALAVINEDYTELLVLDELSIPVSVQNTDNLPYWLSVEAQEGLNSKGHPVLKLSVRKEAGMEEDRQIEGSVTLSTGDVIKLTVKQGGDLPTGANAGEVLTSTNTEFEADWSGSKSISLVTSYVDINGRTQLTTTEVALPWASDALPEEWLPEGEAENMVKFKDAWELVFNLTGIPSRPNYNYFGMYNKYTGKLRIFYYMDQSHMPSGDGNDHMWSLYFSDALAEYPVFQFGVPYSLSATQAYRNVLGSPNILYMTSATTSQMSQTLKVTPRIGWWAFDVDLSQLRPKAMLSRGGYITPGMLLFAQDNIYLNSVLKGDLEGSINGNINLNALRPVGTNSRGLSLSSLTDMGGSSLGNRVLAYSLMGSIKDAPMDMLLSRAAFGACVTMGGIMSIMDADGSGISEPDRLGEIKMDACLNLNAEIQTQGTIGGERSNNISSPKISSEYFMADTHLGQGVWNIQNSPVIYVLKDAYWSGVSNFLTYEKGEEKDASGKVVRTYYKTVKDPASLDLRLISFMDPTSVGSILLNNQIYDANAPVEVSPSFGVFPGADAGYTKGFREGLGIPAQTALLSDTAFETKRDKKFVMLKKAVDDNLFSYNVPTEVADVMAPRLSQQADPSNADLVRRYFGPSMYYFKTNPAVTEVDQVQYVADPQVKLPFVSRPQTKDGKVVEKNGITVMDYFLYDPDYVDWVVTVNLRIEQDGQVYLLSRQFVPEVKVISYKEIPALLDQMRARKGRYPAHVKYPSVDEAIARIQRYYDAIVK